ncbi:MAG: hypothetical protein V3U75_06520 [Methylococcaceae bacterium]
MTQVQKLRLWLGNKLETTQLGLCLTPNNIAIALVSKQKEGKPKLSLCQYYPDTSFDNQLEILVNLTKQHHLKRFPCFIVLALGQYDVHMIPKPEVKQDEIRDAIRWQLSELINYPIEKTVIDYFDLPDSQNITRKNMLGAVVCRQDIINRLTNQFQQTGLNLESIDIQELVLRNVTNLLPENSRGIALLKINQNNGLILIKKQSEIYLSRTLGIGLKHLGICDSILQDDNHRKALNQLALEIQRSLDYYESFYGLPQIPDIFVAPMPEYTELLCNQLKTHHGISARLLDITHSLNCESELSFVDQAHCLSAIGAALTHFKPVH